MESNVIIAVPYECDVCVLFLSFSLSLSLSLSLSPLGLPSLSPSPGLVADVETEISSKSKFMGKDILGFIIIILYIRFIFRNNCILSLCLYCLVSS